MVDIDSVAPSRKGQLVDQGIMLYHFWLFRHTLKVRMRLKLCWLRRQEVKRKVSLRQCGYLTLS